MSNVEQAFPLPNPHDWTDTLGVAQMINRTRATVHDMVKRGVLTRYQIGGTSAFWVPDVREVAASMRRLEARR